MSHTATLPLCFKLSITYSMLEDNGKQLRSELCNLLFTSWNSVPFVSLVLRAWGHSWTQCFGRYFHISCWDSFVKYLFALSCDHYSWVPLKPPQLLKHGLPGQMETRMYCHIVLLHCVSVSLSLHLHTKGKCKLYLTFSLLRICYDRDLLFSGKKNTPKDILWNLTPRESSWGRQISYISF